MSNTNDWFAARLLNSDKPIDFLVTEGIDASNSTMQDKDFYKSKAKVQEAFKKDDGTFDQDKFDKFYNDCSNELGYLSSINTENYILNAYEKSESNFSTNFGHYVDRNIEAERIANPLDQSFGIVAPNTWSTPTKSKREAAQKNQYFDNETGKWSDKTVNEAGLLGLLTGKPLVYATWDEDGEHVDMFTGNTVKHQKGDWKTDEFGNFYAETTNNEENLNKEFVTWSEVLTDDESPWNKIDIFDSDDLDQNIARTLLKGVAIVIPSILVPEIGASIFYSTAAVNLARVLPQISKSIAAFFGAEEFDTLNKWDNAMRKFGSSQSDYSRDHFMSLENILNMAIDSYMQLGTQRAIAEIPQKLGIGNTAIRQMETAQRMQMLKFATAGKMTPEAINALAKSTEAFRQANKVLNNASKLSTAISRGYLIATSVEDVYNQAKSSGFDSQTSGMISLAAYAGIGMLFQTDYFRGILYNTPDYELARDIKLLTRQYLKNNADKMKKDLATATTDIAKSTKLKSWGNSFLKFFKNHISDVKSGRFGIMDGALNEGLEEVSEEMIQDLSFQVGKAWQGIKEQITGNEYTNNYKWLETNPLSRYGQSFFGGALGGAIFKTADRLHFQKDAYKNWKAMMGGDNSQIMKELVSHISQGHADLILDNIDKLQKSPLLSDNISAFTGDPTNNIEESQNAVVFNMMRKAVTDIDSFLTNNNLEIDYGRFGDIELIKGVRAAWLTSMAGNGKGIQDSLFEDYQKRIGEIVSLRAEINSKRSGISDNATDAEKAAINEDINRMQTILDFKIAQAKQLVNGQDDSYLGRLMLESNKELLDRISPTTKNGISKYLYGVEYDELPSVYKAEIDKQIADKVLSGITEKNYLSAWNIYKGIAGDENIKQQLNNLTNSLLSNYVSMNTLDEENNRNFIVLLEAMKALEPAFEHGQIQNAFYKMSGINSPALDFEDTGDISQAIINPDFVNEAEKLFNSWKAVLDVARQKLGNNPELLRKWAAAYENGETSELSNAEAFALLTQDMELTDFMNLINGFYNVLEDDPMGFNGKRLIGRTGVSSKPIDDFINGIINKVVDNNPINTAVLDQQLKIMKSDGNKYMMSDDVREAITQLNTLFDLVTSIAEGSNEEYHNDYYDIPFGANNFLNKTFAEKGIGIELALTNKNVIDAIRARINYFRSIGNTLIRTDKINRGAVVSIEKKLGIKYTEFKIRAIQKLLDDSATPQEFKDFIGNLDLDTKALDKNASDDDFIELSAKYRNELLKFERAFSNYWNSIDLDQKLNLINAIASAFGERLYEDTSSLESKMLDNQENSTFNDATAYMYFMSCSFGNSDIITKAYGEDIKSNDKFPFDSQEDLIVTISKFLLNENKDDVKLWVDAIASDEFVDKYNQIKLYRGIKAVCSGGTGKTSTIMPGIFNIISKVIPGKNVIFASNTMNQVQAIKESINGANTTLISEILKNTTNDDNFKRAYENTIIFIDECTNISMADLKVLDELCAKYNTDVVYLGDVKQHSNGPSVDSAICPMTLQLTESKRSSTDVSRKNNSIFERLFAQNTSGLPALNPVGLDKFTYWESDDRLEGVKFETDGTLTTDSIREFYKSHNLPKDTRVLIFSNNCASLDMAVLSSEYNITFASDFAEIQGAEWDYTLTDIDLHVEDTKRSSDIRDVYNRLKDIYTLFTRHRHGLVSYSPMLLKNLTINTLGTYVADKDNNDKSLYAPVESGIVNDGEALTNFKDYKMRVYDKLELEDTELPQENAETDNDGTNESFDGDSNKGTNLPLGPTDKSKLPEPKTEKRESKASLAQVAVGFLLKKNFTDKFIESLGIKREDYGTVRNLLYRMITEGDMKLAEQLPDSLKGGKFLIKVEYSKTDDLYNLGNLHRDHKDLDGIHPWIVYHVDGKDDIYLGMFHAEGTSASSGSDRSHTLSVINNLCRDMLPSSAPKYYEIPDKLSISRSSNIVDIQNKETEDGTYIGMEYENRKVVCSSVDGDKSNFNFLESSLAIYFRKTNTEVVNTRAILKALNDLRSLYSKFYDLTIKSGLYKDNVDPIKEFLHWNRGDAWERRGVPNLENRFVVFVSLKTNEQVNNPIEYLQSASNSYLSSVQAKTNQLLEMINVLESGASDDFKKEKIEELAANRVMFTSVPLAFDNDTITNEKDFDDAIDRIRMQKERGSTRNRVAYIDAITHQLGSTLQRVAGLIKYEDRLKLQTESDTWFDKNNLEFIKSVWNTYKEQLVRDYRRWSGNTEVDENSVLSFLTETFTKSYETNEIVNVFDNGKSNLLQYDGFRTLLKDLYFNKNWEAVNGKLNRLKFIIKNTDIKLLFEGYVFPHLIKDNGLTIKTKNDYLNIIYGCQFKLNSKVIQQGRIFVYGNEDLNGNDFKEYIDGVTQNEGTNLPSGESETKKEPKKEKNSVSLFNKSVVVKTINEIKRDGGIRLKSSDATKIVDTLNQLYNSGQDDLPSNIGQLVETAVLEFLRSKDSDRFDKEIDSIYSSCVEDEKTRIDTICSILNRYKNLC